MSLFAELKRRNVFRVGAAYAVAAWVLVQIGEAVFPAFGVPDSLFRGMVILLVLGMPLALFLAWAFEVTPQGVKREKDVDRSQSITNETGRKLDRTIIVVLAIAVTLFAIDKFLLGPETGIPDSAATGDGDAQSIAVLPFVNMSSDPEQDFFSDGISEEILNVLAQIPDLRVAARTSSFQFKGRNLDIGKIAGQLNVANVLEGSVRKSGDRLRITAQLIRADDGFHEWSETYDRRLDDIFAIQDEISTAIADALKLRLAVGATDARPAATGTANVEAYETYLLGREQLNNRTRSSIESARDNFGRAVEIDPQFAPAYAYQAIALLLLTDNPTSYGDTPLGEAIEQARPLIDRALELAPQRAEVLAAKGFLEDQRENRELAVEYYDRSLALNPSNGAVRNWKRMALAGTGRFEEMLGVSYDSVRYDPLSKIALYNHGLVLQSFGKTDEARATLERLVSLDEAYGNSALGIFYSRQGELESAVSHQYAALEATPDRVSNRRNLAETLIDLQLFDEALKVDEKTRFYVAIGRADFPLAVDIAERNLARSPRSITFLQELLYARYLARDSAAAASADELWTATDENPYRVGIQALAVMSEVTRAGGDRQAADGYLDSARALLAKMDSLTGENAYAIEARAHLAAVEGRHDDAIAAIAEAIDAGMRGQPVFYLPVFDELQDDPAFIAQRERLAEIVARQRAAVLEMLCGPEPIVSSWEPAPETCSPYEQSGQYRPQVP